MNKDIMHILSSIIRVGKVSALNPSKHTARVIFEDQDNSVSYELQVGTDSAFKNKKFGLPDINEQVLCIFLPINLSQGFIIRSLYNDEDTPADSDSDINSTTYEDGTRVEYNRSTHELKVNCVGNIEATCKNAKISAETQVLINVAGTTMMIDSDGLYINNKIYATDIIKSDVDVIANTVSEKLHTHPGDSGGVTGPPNS